MKFQYKIQPYQTDAVNSVVNVFAGQPYQDRVSYIRDMGVRPEKPKAPAMDQLALYEQSSKETEANDDPNGFLNNPVALTDEQLLLNVRNMQAQNNIRQSDELVSHLGCCSLDVEMETGTGKTYVYIKTVFELNKLYGWSKFIVVVPSVAIREGVEKSFQTMEDHFMEHYGKKARHFIYNSKNLSELDNFSSGAGINVMIINIQAFNARGADARRIYEELDDFGTRKPIDVIAANRPIVILDEPQKMGGEKTQLALKEFNPLFCLNYSATHKQHHDLVYALDAMDAYNKRLVKKIEVKGFDINNFRGTDHYLYLEGIVVSPNKPPKARIEFEVRQADGKNKRISKLLAPDDNLFDLSGGMGQYQGYRISEVDPYTESVTFTNGEVLNRGAGVGNVSELDMRRIQIRETILSHFEKESRNYELGIKTLSLFFIDEVAKYRIYDEDGNEANSVYGDIFEREYLNVLNDYITLDDTPYVRYLKEHCTDPSKAHAGYFSIDKKGRKVDSSLKRGSDESDDISAYELILKNKERLLSFDEPVRFIFSHSALREGWDNPNVFQICTLKHGGNSPTQKRQEVGRGLRLAVDQDGVRMDSERCGDQVQNINMLTVIASEGYRDFVDGLQKGMKEDMYERPVKASQEYFTGKSIKLGEQFIKLDQAQARAIVKYLDRNDYIDEDDLVTDKYRSALEAGTLQPLPENLAPLSDGIHLLIQSIFDEKAFRRMIQDGGRTKPDKNPINSDNFEKFRELWDCIKQQYTYTVKFDSSELKARAIRAIDENLIVSDLRYTVTRGRQMQDMNEHAIEQNESFTDEHAYSQTLRYTGEVGLPYDLIGKIAQGAEITRQTAAEILKGIRPDKFAYFRQNPEEFIAKVIRLIQSTRGELVVDGIQYHRTSDCFADDIFKDTPCGDFSQALQAKKHILEYVFTDGYAEDGKSIERQFAEALESADEVVVYAKLPRKYYIPTPVGNYSPDWAISFKTGSVKHIFFLAETKGTMDFEQYRAVEKAKIKCAMRLYNDASTSKVRYHYVDSYARVKDVMNTLK